MINDNISSQDPNRIQDLFILNNNIIKSQFQDGFIQQLFRQCSTIEGLKESNEDSYEIIQLNDLIRKELVGNFEYETIKYQGRNTISLNFIAKKRDSRVIHQISCMILKNNKTNPVLSIDSTLNKLMKLEHPNVQKMIQFQKTEQFYFIILEECLGSYEDLIVLCNNQINQNTYLKYAGEFISGLDYLLGKVQISSQVCDVRNVKISFNHVGKVPIFIAGMAEINKDEIYEIKEYINSITQQIYRNEGQKSQQKHIMENFANNGHLSQLLIKMLLPSTQIPLQKNYITQNRQIFQTKLNSFEAKEQLLNQIIDIESFYDSNLSKQALENLQNSINYLKKGHKYFQKPIDISITQNDQQILSINFINYDFAQVSQNKYIPIIDQQLINNYYHTYQQQLYQMKKRNANQIGSDYYYSLKSIPQFRDQQNSISRVNELSTIYQNSQIKIGDNYNQNRQVQNIQILEEFISERIENIDLDDQLDQEELKNLIDSLCNINENNEQNTQNKFDGQIYSELIEKVRLKGERLTIQTFLEAYLEYEKDLIVLHQSGQIDFIEGSFVGRQINFTNEHKTSIIRDLESPFKEKEFFEQKDTLFTHEHELTLGNANTIKEKIQLLHKPFLQLLNPPQKLGEIKVNTLMQEVLSIKKDINFKAYITEEAIFKLLDQLNAMFSKREYDKKAFSLIFETIQKRNQILNMQNFLSTYLEICTELQQKLTSLVVQNCDIKSLDQSQLKNIVTFYSVKQHMDSIQELNYLEYSSELKQLKSPFKRIFQKTFKPISLNSIKKKQPNKTDFQKLPNFNFGDPFYKSNLQETQQTQSTNLQITIFFLIIILFLACIGLMLYCIW